MPWQESRAQALRIASVLAVVFLAGCTDGDWASVMSSFDGSPGDAPAAPVVAANAVPTRSADGLMAETCRKAASDRASDVAMQGFNADLQKTVYDKTYADCAAWRGKMR